MVKNTERKSVIREKYQKLRAEISSTERKAAEGRIADRLIESSLFRDAHCIYIYVSFRDEADTRRIIGEALRQRKRVAAPRVRGKHMMEFCFVRSMADLRPGVFGIPEPGPWCPKAPHPGEDVLVVMPGTAFDRAGARIGYGGGFYDAYLEKDTGCTRAALAFSCQIADELPADAHDVRVRYIFTEKEMITCF